MNISKRQEQILELLREQGFITVENLSKLLYTSPASIRRDLTRLEDMCFLKRTHGGASVLNDINHAIPLNSRMTKNIINKKLAEKLKSDKNVKYLIREIIKDSSEEIARAITNYANDKYNKQEYSDAFRVALNRYLELLGPNYNG